MKHRILQRKLAWVSLLALGLANPAMAEVVIAPTGQLNATLEALPTGDQLLVEQGSGSVSFAGHRLELTGFEGLLGYASQAAYVVVVEGEARIGGQSARRGQMLLIPPFGGEIDRQRFDADRLLASLDGTSGEGGAQLQASLARLASGQRRGVFLGRLTPTAFNVTTMGSAQAELDRRSRIGGTAIRASRFSEAQSGVGVEQAIVTRFLDALSSGEAEAVAQMLDPQPFGLAASTDAAKDARLALAQALVAQRDWQAFADVQPIKVGATNWVVSTSTQLVSIELKPAAEFLFISSITAEDRP